MSDTSSTASATPSRLSGTLSGQFIETCDCKSLCPCWADDYPDEDHCTGLFAWQVQSGRLEGDDAASARSMSATPGWSASRLTVVTATILTASGTPSSSSTSGTWTATRTPPTAI